MPEALLERCDPVLRQLLGRTAWTEVGWYQPQSEDVPLRSWLAARVGRRRCGNHPPRSRSRRWAPGNETGWMPLTAEVVGSEFLIGADGGHWGPGVRDFMAADSDGSAVVISASALADAGYSVDMTKARPIRP